MNEIDFALNRGDDDLLEDVGRQAIGTPFAQHLVEVGSIESDVSIGFNAPGDLRELGHRVFTRLGREVFGLVCGGGKTDAADRKTILNASGLSDAAVCGALVTLLTGVFGLTGPFAAAAAVLLLRRVIRPAGEELCGFWSDKLGP